MPDLSMSFRRAFAIPPPAPTVIAPSITTQPEDETITTGTTATLTVEATGTAPLSYQWYEGASGITTDPILSGGTNAIFVTPILTANATYWVRVSISAGFVNST